MYTEIIGVPPKCWKEISEGRGESRIFNGTEFSIVFFNFFIFITTAGQVVHCGSAKPN